MEGQQIISFCEDYGKLVFRGTFEMIISEYLPEDMNDIISIWNERRDYEYDYY